MSFHFLIKDSGSGWNHVREMNVPYTSSAALTLLLTFDNGAVPSFSYVDATEFWWTPTKLKVTMPPNKWSSARDSCHPRSRSCSGYGPRDEGAELGCAEAYRVVNRSRMT